MFSLIKKREITEHDILYCHQLFSANIPNFIDPGKYRKTEVLISGSKAAVRGTAQACKRNRVL